MRRLAAFGTALLLAPMLLGGCTRSDTPVGTSRELLTGGSMTVALGSAPENFNPSTVEGNSTDVKSVTVNLFPGTFRTLPDFTVTLNTDLLESAEVTSMRPQTVVYRIRPGATWSDRTPITAADFAYAWSNQNGTSEADVASTTGYEDVSDVRGSDGGKTVTVVFRRPFADWRSLFGDLLPAHVMRRLEGGWDTGLRTSVPVSGGPFVMSGNRPGDSIVLTRNTSYYAAPARLDRLVYLVLPAAPAQLDALRNGELQMVYQAAQRDTLERARQNRRATTTVSLGATYEHLDFNLRNPLLADVRVRRAFALALDRPLLLDTLIRPIAPDAEVLGNRLYVSTQPEYEDHSGAYTSRDVEGARALLEEAGFARGADGTYARGPERLSLGLLVAPGNPMRADQAVLVQRQLRDAGIDLRIEAGGDDFGSRLGEGRFDVVNFAWTGTAFAASGFAPVFATDGDSNLGGYSNPRVDSLLASALAESDPAKVVSLAQQVDRLLWDDMPTLPLYQRPTLLSFDRSFGGIRDNTSTDTPFADAARWGRLAAG